MMHELHTIGRALVLTGSAILLIGLALVLAGRVPYVGRLPGDIVWRRGHYLFYFPLATCLLVSLLISLVVYLVALIRK